MEARRPRENKQRERRHRHEHYEEPEHERLQRAEMSLGLEADHLREPARLWQELSSPLGELGTDERELR